VAALVTAFGHFTPIQSAAIASLAIAIGTGTAAVMAGTVDQATVAGAAGIIMTDLALLNVVHLSSGQAATITAASGVVLGGFMHLLSARTTPPVPKTAAPWPEVFSMAVPPLAQAGFRVPPPPVLVHPPAENQPAASPPPDNTPPQDGAPG
jgi:hypothetical protein